MGPSAQPVRHKLIPVAKGEYHDHLDQVWADADVEHAADLMREVAITCWHDRSLEMGGRCKRPSGGPIGRGIRFDRARAAEGISFLPNGKGSLISLDQLAKMRNKIIHYNKLITELVKAPVTGNPTTRCRNGGAGGMTPVLGSPAV